MKHLTAFVFFLSLAFLTTAKSTFVKKSDIQSPHHHSVIKSTPEGGYLIATTVIMDTDTGEARAFKVIKYDVCDDLLWEKNFLTNREDLRVMDVYITSDNKILLGGYTRKSSYYAAYIVKLDSDGKQQFSKLIKTSKNVYGYGVGELTNGDYFLYGNAIEGVPEQFWNFVSKMDKNGKTISNNSYFNIAIWGRAIPTSDGGILSNTGDVIFKMDQNGAVQWAGDVSGFSFYNSQPIEVEDGYVYCRYSHSFSRNHSTFLIKLGFNGELLWTGEAFDGTESNNFVRLPNGHFLVAGDLAVDSLTTQLQHVLYTELDENGNIVKQYLQNNTGIGQHFSNGMVLTGNNDIVHLGTNLSTMFLGKGDIVLSKMNYDEGLKGCDLKEVTYTAVPEFTEIYSRTVTPHPQVLTEYAFDLEEESSSHFETLYCSVEEELTLNLGSDTTLCPGETYRIGTNQSFASYNWSTGESTAEITVASNGTYVLTVGDGCEFVSDTIEVNFFPVVKYDFSVSPVNPTPLTPVKFHTNLDSSYHMNWYYDDSRNEVPSFEYFFKENGTYPVYFEFYDVNNCMYADSAEVTVDYFTYFLPNAFTPNGDGKNDVFEPVGFGIRSYEMKIFNRWGELVYSGNNEGWDGADAQLDAYVYTIKVRHDALTEEEKTGVVQLIR